MQTAPKYRGGLRCSRRVNISCFFQEIRRVTLIVKSGKCICRHRGKVKSGKCICRHRGKHKST